MNNKVDIDDVLKDIDDALEQNSDFSDTEGWLDEARQLAKSTTIQDLDHLCDKFLSQPIVIPGEYQPACGLCEQGQVAVFAKEENDTVNIYMECQTCGGVGPEPMPYRMLGKDRTITTLAVYLREVADGFNNVVTMRKQIIRSIQFRFCPLSFHKHFDENIYPLLPNPPRKESHKWRQLIDNIRRIALATDLENSPDPETLAHTFERVSLQHLGDLGRRWQ